MTARTEYIITRIDNNVETTYELRVPKSVNITVLLERLICRDLDDETIIASCLRSNNRRAYDPFKIIDMREDHRREQAKAAFDAAPLTPDSIGVYQKARNAPIPIGKPLILAGWHHEYMVKEVEVKPRRNTRKQVSNP